MKCKILSIILIFSVLQGWEFKSLPVAPADVCSIEEAILINKIYIEEVLGEVDNIIKVANERASSVDEDTQGLLSEFTSYNQQILSSLHEALDSYEQDANVNGEDNRGCLNVARAQIPEVSAKTDLKFTKCSLSCQKKLQSLQGKLIAADKKAQSIKAKANSVMGKCTLQHYLYFGCSDLMDCCEREKSKLVIKTNSLFEKVTENVCDVVSDHRECLDEVVEETLRAVDQIIVQFFTCSSQQPNSPESDVNSDSSAESNESGESGQIQEPQEPNQPEQPQGPNQPEEPNHPEQPQGPSQPEEPNQPEQPQGPNQPEEPNQPEQPQGPSEPGQPEDPNQSELPREPQLQESAGNQQSEQLGQQVPE